MTAPASLPVMNGPTAPPGPWREFWTSFSANQTDSAAFLRPPAWQEGGSIKYLLGTDAIGRDILSRLMYGARLSLSIGLGVVLISVATGIVLGLIAGFARGI